MGKLMQFLFPAILSGMVLVGCVRELPTDASVLGLDSLVISGTVSDIRNGAPVSAVNVMIANEAAVTDGSGNYQIRFVAGQNDPGTERPLIRFTSDKYFTFDTVITINRSKHLVDARLVYAAPGIGKLEIDPAQTGPGSATLAYTSRVEIFDDQGHADIDSVWAFGYYKRPHIPSQPIRWTMQRVAELSDSSALFEVEMPAELATAGVFETQRHRIEVLDRSGFRESRLFILQGN